MTFWHSTYEVARKDVLQHIRTKRLLIIGSLLVISLVLMTLVFGPKILRGSEVGSTAAENFVFLIYFSPIFVGGYFFIQLLAIVLTADAVCSEWANRTIFLLLSKPVSRAAFVTGKFLGSYATVAVTIVVLFSLDYLIMQPLYEGSPDGKEVAGFFAALGVLVLGAGAFSALALFFSSITRSNVMALLFTLGSWIIILPLLGTVGVFIEIGRENDLDSDFAQGWQLLNPGNDMQVAGTFLVQDDAVREGFSFFGGGLDSPFAAMMALVLHIALWFGLSFLIVQRRNFE